MKGEKLVSWIKGTYEDARFSGIELAKVIQTEPNIEIKVDGMEHTLGASFLVVPAKFIQDELVLTADWQVGSKTTESQTAVTDTHVHNISPIHINQMSVENGKTQIKYLLNPGDRIAVIPALGGRRFMILDKVVVK